METGVAHGGSLALSASLCKLMGKGRVIGIDVEIRPHNRAALEAHPLRELMTLIEGSSIDPAVAGYVRAQIRAGETVLVLLDSNHSKAHVAAELEAYCGLVAPGSYQIVADGLKSVGGGSRVSDDASRIQLREVCAAVRRKPGWLAADVLAGRISEANHLKSGYDASRSERMGGRIGHSMAKAGSFHRTPLADSAWKNSEI